MADQLHAEPSYAQLGVVLRSRVEIMRELSEKEQAMNDRISHMLKQMETLTTLLILPGSPARLAPPDPSPLFPTPVPVTLQQPPIPAAGLQPSPVPVPVALQQPPIPAAGSQPSPVPVPVGLQQPLVTAAELQPSPVP